MPLRARVWAVAAALVVAAQAECNEDLCEPGNFTSLCKQGTSAGRISPYQDGVCYSPLTYEAVIARSLKRPPANATVYVSLLSNSVRKLSALDASFVFDAYLRIAWRDERLNASAISAAVVAISGDESDSFDWAMSLGAFQPALEFANALTLTSSAPSTASYVLVQGAPGWTGVNDYAGSWLSAALKVSGTFLQPQSLRDFPFDSQKASISLQSSKWASSLVTLAFPPNASSALVPPAGVDGWDLDSVDLRLGTNLGNIEVARATFTLSLRRIPAFYITRFIQPLCLLMTMAIVSVLFAHNPGRIAIPFTSFGAVISFLFVATNSNPVLPYSTRLDRFFLLCFYVAWIIFMFNVASFLFGDRLARLRADAAKRRPLRAAQADGSDPTSAKAPTDPALQQLQSAGSWASCICSNVLCALPERVDITMAVLLEIAFAIGVAVVLKGPRFE